MNYLNKTKLELYLIHVFPDDGNEASALVGSELGGRNSVL